MPDVRIPKARYTISDDREIFGLTACHLAVHKEPGGLWLEIVVKMWPSGDGHGPYCYSMPPVPLSPQCTPFTIELTPDSQYDDSFEYWRMRRIGILKKALQLLADTLMREPGTDALEAYHLACEKREIHHRADKPIMALFTLADADLSEYITGDYCHQYGVDRASLTTPQGNLVFDPIWLE